MAIKKNTPVKNNIRVQVNFAQYEIRYLELISSSFKGLKLSNTARLLINYLIDNNVDINELKAYIETATVRSIYGKNYRIKALDKTKEVEEIFKDENSNSNESVVLNNLNDEVKNIFFHLTKELNNNDD